MGDIPEQTLDELRAVTKTLIQSRQEGGVPLPPVGNGTADRQGELHGSRVTYRELHRNLGVSRSDFDRA